MPSRATKAAEATARDAERRLKAVPDLPPEPAKPLTKGDAARKAARDALEPWQQAVYDQIMGDGGRHPTALAQARKVTAPEPGEDTTSPQDAAPVTVTEASSDAEADPFDVNAMFAAFNAMSEAGGAQSLPDAVPVIAAQHKDEQDAEPKGKPPAPKPVPVPQPKPQAAQPKPAAPKPARPAPKPSAGATCTVQAVPFDRHLGTVTTADSVVHDCEHAARNGHIEKSAALGCAKRLLRNYPAGQVGTRVKSRYNGAYTPNGDGAQQVLCGCRFGHKEEAAAVACAKARAAQAGLVA